MTRVQPTPAPAGSALLQTHHRRQSYAYRRNFGSPAGPVATTATDDTLAAR
ncbi:hypothetical protein ACTWQF_27610 [Streptomyces sp. 8N114]|uniref:hypothetical protein n=1 Tax=Streptomyces sp. 8N114 TaxID=3457419 RepID=UPI003FD3B999